MQTAAALKRLPALFGGEEVMDELKTLVDDEEINRVVDYLRSLLADLKELGADRHISLDLGIVGRNEYYTGIVFQGYTEGIGDTVLTGGRYDTLLSDYGMDLPAIGFGIDVDAVARVVRREMSFQLLPDVLVFPYPGFEVKAMKEIQKLVSMGSRPEFCICETSMKQNSTRLQKASRPSILSGKTLWRCGYEKGTNCADQRPSGKPDG